MQRQHVLSGIDRIEQADALLRGRRIGLMTNPTGIDHDLNSTVDLVHKKYGLSALYAVEHGIRGDAQAGAKVENTVDPQTGVTVYSAFGKNSHFTDEMLAAFDVLIFDIQDVGARFYTYLYSLSYAMEACARAGKSIIVLDRVNPLGGMKLSGTVLDTRFSSFVGDYELPTQYALTIGEYARYVKDYLHLDVDLTVVPLSGWRRHMLLDDTDLPWVSPSPNCPHLESALCYTGMCIFEGANISEGRGTTIPFQVAGAPFIDGTKLAKEMNRLGLPGLHFRETSFRPTFSKHEGELCHGVQLHITDREYGDCALGGLLLMETIRRMYGEQFEFLYSEEFDSYFVDKLLGTDLFRLGKMDARELIEHFSGPIRRFRQESAAYFLYNV
ncbi:MAG: DUF1343 domain-containing protein [Clostridia bacterium]|nr:DUF1343 domain-containing protein [Clostridia bacterium]